MISIDELITRKFKQSDKSKLRGLLVLFLQWLIREQDLQVLQKKYADLKATSFCDALLREFIVNVQCKHLELENIPSQGRCLVLANHPVGALDALALVVAISKIRDDIKIIASELLSGVDNLRPILIPIDYERGIISESSMQEIFKHGKDGLLIHFPALEVSRNSIYEKYWHSTFISIVRKLQCPILPVFISARHTLFFKFVAMISQHLSKLLLPREMWWMKNSTINLTIGELIPFKQIFNNQFSEATVTSRLRKHLIHLGEDKELIFRTEAGIALPEKRSHLKQFLNKLTPILSIESGLQVYLCGADANSPLLKEIGRLREISFRTSGTGSGKAYDTDKFDNHYKHLVLWNDAELEIMGAYRLGIGKEIMAQQGSGGFYSSTLYSFSPDFLAILPESIEFGRSFVQPKYWNSKALEHLWAGIGAFISNHQEIKFFFGPVSLPDSLSSVATSLIVAYYQTFYTLHGSQNVSAQHRYPYLVNKTDLKEFSSIFTQNDPVIRQQEFRLALKNMGSRIPTLFKQYSELVEDGGVAFVSFGIDPDFTNCIDGLMLLRCDYLKQDKLKRYNISRV
ncbi:MAG: lysophospholipid acyltransferase family protein [Methylacidiphilales bacterium]|nr:lysophospholipid acyltransferase family protein [Candidatus Methylacidiphilales bacterium]